MSEEALQIAEKRREGKSKLEKEKYTHLNAEFQIIVKAQTVKRRPAMWETQVRSLGWEDPLEKGKIYATECRVPKNSKNSKESLHKRTMQRNRRKQ